MSDQYKYYVNWSQIDQNPIGKPFNFWGCDNKNVGYIIEHHDNLGEFILYYTDFWTLPYPSKEVRVRVVCQSLHAAKCIGDKASKEFREYVTESDKNPQPFI